jgi:hypothetical protein
MTDVTVLGVGLMGAAIARTLLREGLSVTVWNRTPDKTAPLVAEGAALATSPTEAIHASPVSLLVIFSYENVTSILGAAAAEGPVGDIVNLVTGSPSEADELQRWAREHQLSLLDGALLTYPKGIGGRRTLVVYAGDSDVWARHEAGWGVGIPRRGRTVGERAGPRRVELRDCHANGDVRDPCLRGSARCSSSRSRAADRAFAVHHGPLPRVRDTHARDG